LSRSPADVRFRVIVPADLDAIFEQEQDPESVHMAAFTPKDPADRAAFDAHWNRLLEDDSIIKFAIVADNRVAGSVMSYLDSGRREVTYWIGREYWGRGLATAALAELTRRIPTRPLYARAAKDNVVSLRVLEKCGFAIIGEDRGFANARGAEIEEYILALE
jgi:RimJ/RimL family protein N-acetyltransferase